MNDRTCKPETLVVGDVTRYVASKDLPRLEDGSLPYYAWPGFYPLLYWDGWCSLLCPKCANEQEISFQPTDDDAVGSDPRDLPKEVMTHMEGPPATCEVCGEVIPSAYGWDEGQEDQDEGQEDQDEGQEDQDEGQEDQDEGQEEDGSRRGLLTEEEVSVILAEEATEGPRTNPSDRRSQQPLVVSEAQEDPKAQKGRYTIAKSREQGSWDVLSPAGQIVVYGESYAMADQIATAANGMTGGCCGEARGVASSLRRGPEPPADTRD